MTVSERLKSLTSPRPPAAGRRGATLLAYGAVAGGAGLIALAGVGLWSPGADGRSPEVPAATEATAAPLPVHTVRTVTITPQAAAAPADPLATGALVHPVPSLRAARTVSSKDARTSPAKSTRIETKKDTKPPAKVRVADKAKGKTAE